MRRKRKIGILLLLLFFVSIWGPLAPVEAADDLTSQLFPDEAQLGVNTGGTELIYKKYPMERFGFDSGMSLIELDGLVPVVGDIGSMTTNSMASTGLGIAGWISRASILLLQMSFHTNVLTDLLSGITSRVIGIRNNMMSSFFGLFALGFTVWVLWNGLVKGQTTRTFKGILTTIAVLSVAGWTVMNLQTLLPQAAELFDDIALKAMGSISAASTGERWENSADIQIVSTANAIWTVVVDEPWQFGTFGMKADGVKVTDAEAQEALSNDVTGVRAGDNWRDVLLSKGLGTKERSALATILADEDINHGSHGKTVDTFGPGGSPAKFLISLGSILTSIGLLVMVLPLSFGMIFSQFLMLGLAIGLALVVVAALIPEIGTKIIERWAKLMAGALMAKVVLGIFFGIVLLLMESSLSVDWPVFGRQMLVLVVLAGSLWFLQKKIMPQYGGNFMNQAVREGKKVYNKSQKYGNNQNSGSRGQKDYTERDYDDPYEGSPEYNADLEGFQSFRDEDVAAEAEPWSSSIGGTRSGSGSGGNSAGGTGGSRAAAQEAAATRQDTYDSDTMGEGFVSLVKTAPPSRASKRWLSPAEMAENQRLARQTKFITEDMIATDQEMIKSFDVDRDSEFIKYDDEIEINQTAIDRTTRPEEIN